MVALDMASPATVICGKCGKAYSKLTGSFYKSYAELHKGRQYMPICRDCTDGIFLKYFEECGDKKRAMRQFCRKLDIYWSEKAFDSIDDQTTNNTVVSTYLQRMNQFRRAGKSYDDTLREEGMLWAFPSEYLNFAYAERRTAEENAKALQAESAAAEEYEVPDDVIAFWGAGYSPAMYNELEQRKQYYMSSFPDESENDVGLLSVIRQICALELDINRDRAAGKDVSKSVATHNTLLGAAGLKPIQKEDGTDAAFEKTPFGVWIDRWENKRPIPEPDPDFKDVDGIVRYITIWFLGHLCKMLGIRNSYCKLYEDEIAKMRVEHPEFEEDDDETLFNDIFTSSVGGDSS